MSKSNQFGENVEGYAIPVLNEREIRATAGILFLFMFISIMIVIFKGDFLMLKYMVSIFLADMIVRVFISPKFSPLLIIGRMIVSRQTPLYVGAAQKKFAWIIGLVLSGTIFILLNVVNSFSVITGLICFVCLIFLFFETAFGICIGCKVYGLFNKDKAQYCPGEICDPKEKQDIQKTSGVQLAVVFALVGYVAMTVVLFNDTFRERPRDLWKIIGETSSK
ncbi:MAG: DUF4395 domain-containing protein [Cytophagales bacterium]|nr:DUF4395 domain-containing protein [Cytophagales bacterium]